MTTEEDLVGAVGQPGDRSGPGRSPAAGSPAGRARRPRAGRNLPAAVAVGVTLAGVALVGLYVGKVGFAVFAGAAVLAGLAELRTALATTGVRLPYAPVAIGGTATVAGTYVGGAPPLLLGLTLTVLAVLVVRLRGTREGYLRDVTAGIFATAYLPFLAGFAMLLLRGPDGSDALVVLILLVVCSDVGGYATGVFLGRHPMAPTVSPKKSWEGFAGSLTAGGLAGALALPLLLGGSSFAGMLLGVAVVTTATLGDLGESLIKRDLGVKDMSSLLPGHGGVLDRLDSLLPCAPVTYVLLGWLL